jgi:hypothetical protein
MVYNGGDSTDTDKKIIRSAGIGLVSALIIVVVGALSAIAFAAPLRSDNFNIFVLPTMPGALSAIGIVLTVALRHKITIAANIHECRRRRFTPMTIHWPKSLGGEDGAGRAVEQQIRLHTNQGLSRFSSLFAAPGGKLSHERLPSRVHAQADLAVQGYVLALASQRPDHQKEIERKAFVVALSHWLDDLLDGRREHAVVRALRCNDGYDFGLQDGNLNSAPGRKPKDVFRALYQREIGRYTDRDFYYKLEEMIETFAVDVDGNRPFMYFGLNRVAAGAAMFSPRVGRLARRELLGEHNRTLLALANGRQGWHGRIHSLLVDMNRGGPGRILLGLTTKTVQELAMSSEGIALKFPLALLYSVLYAPLLYFHDVADETQFGEMMPLDSFDVAYDEIIPWLEEIRRLCREADDNRKDERFQQVEMAYRCFEPQLPEPVRDVLEPIYVTPPGKEPPGYLRMAGDGTPKAPEAPADSPGTAAAPRVGA